MRLARPFACPRSHAPDSRIPPTPYSRACGFDQFILSFVRQQASDKRTAQTPSWEALGYSQAETENLEDGRPPPSLGA